MRRLPHDWRKLASGAWVAEHGNAEVGKDLTLLNGYAAPHTEVLLLNAGLIQEDHDRYERWKDGDVPLPQPSFTSLLDGLVNMVLRHQWHELMLRLDQHDSGWALHTARMDERRRGDH